MTMNVTITIASYNSCDVTRNALRSLVDHAHGFEYEIIIVDNGSSDGSVEMIEREFPQVRLVKSDKNMGFAAAHNLALQMAAGRYLLVLNSDVLFLENSIAQMCSRLDREDERVGIVGPCILNPDRSVAPSSRRRILYPWYMNVASVVNQYYPLDAILPVSSLKRRGSTVLGKLDDDFDPPSEAERVEWIDGMCVMLKREVLEDIGGFDEQFFFDYEIGDLLIRARLAGWHIVFDPAIRVVHLGGYSRNRFSRLMLENRRSQLIYYARHAPRQFGLIRRAHLVMLNMKLSQLRMSRVAGREDPEAKRAASIMEETKRMVGAFQPASVHAGARIPRISAQRVSAHALPEGQAVNSTC